MALPGLKSIVGETALLLISKRHHGRDDSHENNPPDGEPFLLRKTKPLLCAPQDEKGVQDGDNSTHCEHHRQKARFADCQAISDDTAQTDLRLV
jgi:hypothetical protein